MDFKYDYVGVGLEVDGVDLFIFFDLFFFRLRIYSLNKISGGIFTYFFNETVFITCAVSRFFYGIQSRLYTKLN